MKIFNIFESAFPSLEYPRIDLNITNSDISKLHPTNWARAIVTHMFLETTRNAGIA
jgi:hypothetical protein